MKQFMMKKKKSFDVGEQKSESALQWEMFVKVVVAHIDPVLASMLYATQFLQFDAAQNIVRVATLKKFVLFQDLFIEQKKFYQEYLDRVFGFNTVLVVEFINVDLPKKIESKVVPDQNMQTTQASKIVQPILKAPNRASDYKERSSLDLSDKKKWKMTHELLEHFGGTVKEIIKDTHEFDA